MTAGLPRLDAFKAGHDGRRCERDEGRILRLYAGPRAYDWAYVKIVMGDQAGVDAVGKVEE
jgi:hypothetical protein